ncbi:hypothetical protein J4H86_12710 [Spiractinospora alimapuensis]|nr:Mut7-C ubiquitin/RNAse domain-containing protein [Spiractinospora alimapuensis]QVQ54876.1 hypothetical protein J4H86_12710 [Spiractinospora alimapuensis]
MSELRLAIAEELRFLLPPRRRTPILTVTWDGTASLGHVVRSAGVPLTEVGALTVNGSPRTPGDRPTRGDLIEVHAVRRPETPPFTPLRFLLDVHLGTLARRLRLLGIDTAYDNDRDDPSLVLQANAEERVLLTQDRGLLHRGNLLSGAFVRGSDPDDQLDDVLRRFAPPLAPWTRCTNCNGELSAVSKEDIQQLLDEGTKISYDAFARCGTCGQVYWPGAHHDRLARIVAEAETIVAEAGSVHGG